MSDNKYKTFRNFMVNELGISREDIKEWTMQAVAETVEKVMRSVNIEKLAYDIANNKIKSVYEYSVQKDIVAKALENVVRDKLKISLTLKEVNDD